MLQPQPFPVTVNSCKGLENGCNCSAPFQVRVRHETTANPRTREQPSPCANALSVQEGSCFLDEGDVGAAFLAPGMVASSRQHHCSPLRLAPRILIQVAGRVWGICTTFPYRTPGQSWKTQMAAYSKRGQIFIHLSRKKQVDATIVFDAFLCKASLSTHALWDNSWKHGALLLAFNIWVLPFSSVTRLVFWAISP